MSCADDNKDFGLQIWPLGQRSRSKYLNLVVYLVTQIALILFMEVAHILSTDLDC